MKKTNNALIIGIGIFLSKIAGLVRERALAHYFGSSDAGDAFKAALRIPNFLQNLLGEGALSASFIPVYANLIAQEHNQQVKTKDQEVKASDVALTIGTLLFLLTSLLVILGMLFTPILIDIITPGFSGEKKELTQNLVRIFFPGTGLLVMSAWCLGILNSHKKFFLSYAAPVLWNAAIIAAILIYGSNSSQYDLAIKTGWGLVCGSFLQFIIQLPLTIKLLKTFTPKLKLKTIHAKTVLKNFVPSVISRGVVQISSYIDNIFASFLGAGAISNLVYAQTLYLLPVSLFGMSISASELPEMSSLIGNKEEIYQKLKERLINALQKVSFFIIPSICAFVFIGDTIISLFFQTGRFTQNDTNIVWIILIGSSIGLLASTFGRIYSSSFYALKDTKTTLNFAIIRILFNTGLSYLFAFVLYPKLSLDPGLSPASLSFAAGLCGWIEYFLLRRKLSSIIGPIKLARFYLSKIWISAIIAGIVALGIKEVVSPLANVSILLKALIIIAIFGITYFSFTYVFNVDESKKVLNKILKKIRR